jgi:hypothetical protein
VLFISKQTIYQLNRFIIEGDSQIVILALQNLALSQDWWISSLIFDSIPTPFSWEVRKINRRTKFCAHFAAHWTAARSFSGRIPIYPPRPFVPIVSGKDLFSLVFPFGLLFVGFSSI